MDAAALAYLAPLVAVALVGLAITLAVMTGTLLVRHAGGAAARRLDLPFARRERPEVLRRCDGCGRGWAADGRSDHGALALWVRREVRRRARSRGDTPPGWSRASGWRRCPSCLSTQVRTSGDPPQPTAPVRSRSVLVAGGVCAALGVLLLTVAVLGLLTAGSA